MKRTFIIHPLLFSLYPILTLFNHNFDELFLDILIQPVIQIIFIMFLTWYVLNLYIKGQHRTAVIVSLIFLLALSYGRFIGKTYDVQFVDLLFPVELFANKVVVLFSLFLIIFASFLIKKININFRTLTFKLNVISVVLVIVPLLNISYKQAVRTIWHPDALNTLNSTNAEFVDKNITGESPDIYYIILDRYASNRTLKDYYGFDNSDFTDFLKSRGFYVAARSNANYHFTNTSLSSSLNMRYHDELIKEMGPDSTDKALFNDLIENNRVIKIIKSLGYKYFHFGANWPTRSNQNADFVYSYLDKSLAEVQAELVDLKNKSQSPLVLFFDELLEKQMSIGGKQGLVRWRERLDKILEVSKTAELEGPKFVFFHSLITHTPYVFDEEGRSLTKVSSDPGLREEYINQLKFANKIIKNLIDTLLQGSKTPPIIILQGDEGPFPKRFVIESDKFDWNKATPDEIKEKMGILNAYYFPGASVELLYDSISPVNSFRMLFNLYFGQNFPLLNDLSYVQVDSDHPYNVTDVSDVVK